jgi:Tfp pilus assembly protein PilV
MFGSRIVRRCGGKADRGATLLEVALAMAVMAVCVLGQLSTQIALARHAQAMGERERAALAADAIAEASLGVAAGAADQWKARVPAIVPRGAVAFTSAAGDASVVTVTWAATRYEPTRDAAPPEVCNGVPVARDHACFALTFAK